jgi:ABC-type bacteriocin/lantibiotic exporter with double-glycine peptidase domain
MAFSFFVLSRIAKRYSRLSAEKQAEMSARNFECVSGIREIQSLAIETQILRRIKRTFLQFRKLDMILRTFGNIQGVIGSLSSAVGTLLYSWYGATLVITGRMTVGELMAFTTFIGYLYKPLISTVGLIVPIQEVLVYTRRFFEIYDLKSEVKDPQRPVKIKGIEGHVTYSGVSFAYRSGRMVLKDINMDIPAGSRVAIIGETGSGKTTLMHLLPRFYDPKQGTITVDGVDVRQISLCDLRCRIGMVMQNPFLFAGTIYENITCGRRCFNHRAVIEAAKAADAHAFIAALPRGYDTTVGERGATLSGGEQQRIALARVFLLDRPILILDEPMSNIDQKTGASIRRALKRLSRRRTTFIITHQLSTVQDADIIFMMHRGRIVEQGNHSPLRA